VSIPLYRNLLAIGNAAVWAQRCTGEAEALLDQLVPELEAARCEAGLLYVQALKAMERHHEEKLVLVRWIVAAEALAQLVRGEIDALTGGLIRP